jgi:RNA polymerase sigma factor (sigma-70 family)
VVTGTEGRPRGFAARLAAAREGDASAWAELYHGVAPMLLGYLRAQRSSDPEDVAGEVLLEVVRDLHRFAGDERGFRSWVLAIAHHRMLDARRRVQRRPATSLPAEELEPHAADDDPEAETLANLGFAELAPALATLTEDQRAVLLLRVVGDLSIAEVAEVLGKRTGAIKQLQRRAADAMRRSLDATAPVRATPIPRGGRSTRDAEATGDAHPATRTAR